jgi:hypothetical protein
MSVERVFDLPFSWTYTFNQRFYYDSLQELPEQLPEEYWDYPRIVQRHIDKLYGKKKEDKIDIEEIQM